jgi:hypothetical protein
MSIVRLLTVLSAIALAALGHLALALKYDMTLPTNMPALAAGHWPFVAVASP